MCFVTIKHFAKISINDDYVHPFSLTGTVISLWPLTHNPLNWSSEKGRIACSVSNSQSVMWVTLACCRLLHEDILISCESLVIRGQWEIENQPFAFSSAEIYFIYTWNRSQLFVTQKDKPISLAHKSKTCSWKEFRLIYLHPNWGAQGNSLFVALHW